MIYFVIAILSFLVLKVFYNNDKLIKKTISNKFILLISFLIIFLPHALRYGIGTDYFYTYVPGFFRTARGELFYNEYLFDLLNKIIYFFTDDFRYLFFICSFLFFIFIYKGILDNSRNIPLSVLLIFLTQVYFYSMNMVRQSIAIAIIFYSFKFIKEQKHFKFCIFNFIAFLIHSSAIIMLPFSFLVNLNIKKRNKLLVLLFMIFFSSLFGDVIFNFINKYTEYGWYYDSVYSKEIIPITLVLLNLVLFFIDLIFIKNSDKYGNILSNIIFFTICVIIISPAFPLVNRIIKYFTVFHLLYIPYIFKVLKNSKFNFYLKTCVLLMFFTIMFYQIYILGGEAVLPYVSIFS